jgi:hypothetical protein
MLQLHHILAIAIPQYALAIPQYAIIFKFLLYMIFYPRPGLFLKYVRFEKFFKNFFLNE